MVRRLVAQGAAAAAGVRFWSRTMLKWLGFWVFLAECGRYIYVNSIIAANYSDADCGCGKADAVKEQKVVVGISEGNSLAHRLPAMHFSTRNVPFAMKQSDIAEQVD
jgi:hypothetical protein